MGHQIIRASDARDRDAALAWDGVSRGAGRGSAAWLLGKRLFAIHSTAYFQKDLFYHQLWTVVWHV
uniref:Uncharacterized protein n=1 Tax=Oryza sativa subsp. japonica TaxID=39947 RepID=Q6H6M3_ORYSJ|nr:hypothetical protein [Oryza sativa Japonica Group]